MFSSYGPAAVYVILAVWNAVTCEAVPKMILKMCSLDEAFAKRVCGGSRRSSCLDNVLSKPPRGRQGFVGFRVSIWALAGFRD